jgi:hypothetical protein
MAGAVEAARLRGWVADRNPDQKWFWRHSTGAVRWVDPCLVEWIAAKDPEGMPFWTNVITGDATWEDPVVFEVLPGAAAPPQPEAQPVMVAAAEVLDVIRVSLNKLQSISEMDEVPDPEEAAAIMESQGHQDGPSGGVSRTLDNAEV